MRIIYIITILLGFNLILSSCYSENKKLPEDLKKAINKYKGISKNSLTNIELNPKSKFYLNLKKDDIIKDSFEIINLGNNDFIIDYLNNGTNDIKIINPFNTVKSKSRKKILFEYKINRNFIEENGRLSFLILVVGNSSNNISVLRINGIIN